MSILLFISSQTITSLTLSVFLVHSFGYSRYHLHMSGQGDSEGGVVELPRGTNNSRRCFQVLAEVGWELFVGYKGSWGLWFCHVIERTCGRLVIATSGLLSLPWGVESNFPLLESNLILVTCLTNWMCCRAILGPPALGHNNLAASSWASRKTRFWNQQRCCEEAHAAQEEVYAEQTRAPRLTGPLAVWMSHLGSESSIHSSWWSMEQRRAISAEPCSRD